MKRKKAVKPLSSEDQLYAKALIKKYDKTVRRVISAYLDPKLMAEFEDVVQNVYEAICSQLDDFRTYNSQEALVVTIASRAVWRVHRNRKETVPLADEHQAKEMDRGLEDIFPSSISDEDKKLLISIYEHMDTEKEVADDMGEKPATIRQRVKRARDRLKETLKDI